MKLTAQPVPEARWATGDVIAIFSGSAFCDTGLVISILSRRVLSPDMYLNKLRNASLDASSKSA